MGSRKLRLVSWNVNGLRAVLKKDFLSAVRKMDADVLGIQETKLQESQLTKDMTDVESYKSFWSHSEVKKGYSGVGVYSRVTPDKVGHGIGLPEFDGEGRILELDLEDFIFFNVYFPNGQMSDERLDYKLRFYDAFFAYAKALKEEGRSLVICGDYNTAHNEIDLKNPKSNEKRSGFLREERDKMDEILKDGYVDTFRHFFPDLVKYSWWTYRFKAREKNVGWRIDYFFVTADLLEKTRKMTPWIDNDIFGSDHCPIGLDLEF